MAQASIAGAGWDFELDRGPDWLFVRPRRSGVASGDLPTFAEQVWTLLEQQFTARLVLELDEVDDLDSELVSQLVWLCKRLRTRDGMMRICGLSADNAEVLRACRMEEHFPSYETREDAVMGAARPRMPR